MDIRVQQTWEHRLISSTIMCLVVESNISFRQSQTFLSMLSNLQEQRPVIDVRVTYPTTRPRKYELNCNTNHYLIH